MKNSLLNKINEASKLKLKQLAILVDPDKCDENYIIALTEKAASIGAHYFFVGGSLLSDGDLNATVQLLKEHSNLPIILFPGSSSQIAPAADGILFLSLLSSRNPEMLIGQQVIAAPYLRKTNLEVLSTAYLLIDSGTATTASYMSNSTPIPQEKSEIAACTALAGAYMGMKLIYLDGGSGAKYPVPAKMIAKVREYVDQTIIVGGGINNFEKAKTAYEAGADLLVIGNAFEKEENFSQELANYLIEVNGVAQ